MPPKGRYSTSPRVKASEKKSFSAVESGSEDLRLFNCLLGRYHYLGHRNTVGENIRYLVRLRPRPMQRASFSRELIFVHEQHQQDGADTIESIACSTSSRRSLRP